MQALPSGAGSQTLDNNTQQTDGDRQVSGSVEQQALDSEGLQSNVNGARQQLGSTGQQPSDSAAEGGQPRSDAPAFLLVHGFGAFGEQWRGQIKALTAAGYQVCVMSCHAS